MEPIEAVKPEKFNMQIKTKRWRGYYRALKNKEEWAIYFSKLSPLQQSLRWVHRDKIFDGAMKTGNPYADLIKHDKGFWGSFKIPGK